MSSDIPRGLDRRTFVSIGLGAFVVAALPLAAHRRHRLVRRSVPVMGTVAELAVAGADERHAQVAIDAAIAALRDVERTMTRFAATSDVGRANLGAFAAPVAVSAATVRVVEEALAWADATGGAFDPALGGAVELWDVGNRHEPPPSPSVGRLAGRGLWRAVEADLRAALLRLHDRDARLDLGGIAKGWGVDRAVDALRDHGIRNALVNVGGDLYALGTSAGGDPWQVGVQDPDDSRAVIASVALSDEAVATSGTYQQFFRHRGSRYHHLLDPVTAAPRLTSTRSLTVCAGSCLQADAAATALFGMPADAAARILARRAPGARIALAV